MRRIALELALAVALATAIAMSTGGLRGDAVVATVRDQIALALYVRRAKPARRNTVAREKPSDALCRRTET